MKTWKMKIFMICVYIWRSESDISDISLLWFREIKDSFSIYFSRRHLKSISFKVTYITIILWPLYVYTHIYIHTYIHTKKFHFTFPPWGKSYTWLISCCSVCHEISSRAWILSISAANLIMETFYWQNSCSWYLLTFLIKFATNSIFC